MKKVSIVIPCYNEEEALPLYFKAVDPVIKKIEDYEFGFVLVDDGSKDRTLEVMNELYMSRDDVTIVKESRNYGQNAALTAGLLTADGDYVVMMDVDLQDPVTLLKEICKRFSEGYEVVNPHRASRNEDSWFKRTTAGIFYKFINRLEGKKVIPENVNCFRGLSRKALDALNALPEKDRYYVALVPLVGFKTTTIDFSREKRSAGSSKYHISKMFQYAFNLISVTTAKPLFLPIQIGAVLSCFNFVLTLLFLILALTLKNPFAFYLCFFVFLILFVMSILIFFMGINSLYLHNILINTRERPVTTIEKVYRPEDKKTEISKEDN